MPRRIFYWAARKIGNRGVVLVTLGFMWAIYGLGLLLDEDRDIGLPEDWFPWWIRALWWLIPGLWAMAAGIFQDKTEDATAWGLLMLPVLLRWLSIIVAWIMTLTHHGEWQHYPRPWAGFAIFLAFLVLIDRNAAGLDRLPPPRRRIEKRETDE